jgi:hypothetical protein
VNQANWRSATDQWLEKASQIGRRAAAEVLSARRYAARPCRLAPHHTLESKPPHRCPRPLSVHYSTPAASVPSAATESCSNRARACRSCVDLVKDLGPTIGVAKLSRASCGCVKRCFAEVETRMQSDECERRFRQLSLAYEVMRDTKMPAKATDAERLSLLFRAFVDKATTLANLEAAQPKERGAKPRDMDSRVQRERTGGHCAVSRTQALPKDCRISSSAPNLASTMCRPKPSFPPSRRRFPGFRSEAQRG